MKAAQKFSIFFLTLLVVIGCSKDDGPEPTQETFKSNAKRITSFVFRADTNSALVADVTATIDEVAKTISATVPFNTDVSSLNPEISFSDKASIDPNGARDFSDSVTYTVTAEDGSTASYSAILTIAPNSAKEIISLAFLAEENEALEEDVAATLFPEKDSIGATVPMGTNVSNLMPLIQVSEGASITPNTAQDFTEPVQYTVTAQDSTTTSYIVTVSSASSSESKLEGFVFYPSENPFDKAILGVIDEESQTVEVIVPPETDLTELLPNVFTSSGATYSPEGTQDFTQPVIYTITAEDGSQTTYEVTVTFTRRDVLIAIFEANPNNKLDWVLSDTDIENWTGVIVSQGRIKRLHLSGKKLEVIPPEISGLTDLIELDINNNDISELPEEMGALTNLTSLNIGINAFSEFPSVIVDSLLQLKELKLSGNFLGTLPIKIGQLQNLENLSVGNNGLSSLPVQLWQLSGLKSLNLGYNELTFIPSQIRDLSALTELHIGNNPLGSINTIWNLTNLKILSLNQLGLSELPNQIFELQLLEELLLQNNDIVSLPSEIQQLTQLKRLLMNGNVLASLPESIGTMTNLEELYFNSNQLTSIPEKMGELANLQRLWLYNNNLSGIPQEVCDLEIEDLRLDEGVICK